MLDLGFRVSGGALGIGVWDSVCFLRAEVEEKPNVIKSPHYAGRGGDIVDEEAARG